MADIYLTDVVDVDLNREGLHRSRISRTIGKNDDSVNRFGVRLFRNGMTESLSGATVKGYFTDAAGTRTTITGSVSGNTAFVTLPDDCYETEGDFRLAIKLTQSGVTATVRIVDGTVVNTNYVSV